MKQFFRIVCLGVFFIMVGCSKLTDHVDFKNLVLPKTPNYYLICPTDYCSVTPNKIAPIFHESLQIVQKKWNEIISKQPRIQLLYSNRQQNTMTYIQRSKLFRFPDYIYVRLIALSNDQTTIALYSRSKYGHSDFGVNKKRLQQWLQLLKIAVAH